MWPCSVGFCRRLVAKGLALEAVPVRDTKPPFQKKPLRLESVLVATFVLSSTSWASRSFCGFPIREYNVLQRRPGKETDWLDIPPEIRKIRLKKEEADQLNVDIVANLETLLEKHRNIVAVGPGIKIIQKESGEWETCPAVKIFVLLLDAVPIGETQSLQDLHVFKFPTVITEGFMIPTGYHPILDRFEYAALGASVGVLGDIGAGSSGGVVADARGNRYLLSNEHVLHAASKPDEINILHPAEGDLDRLREDKIAILNSSISQVEERLLCLHDKCRDAFDQDASAYTQLSEDMPDFLQDVKGLLEHLLDRGSTNERLSPEEWTSGIERLSREVSDRLGLQLFVEGYTIAKFMRGKIDHVRSNEIEELWNPPGPFHREDENPLPDAFLHADFKRTRTYLKSLIEQRTDRDYVGLASLKRSISVYVENGFSSLWDYRQCLRSLIKQMASLLNKDLLQRLDESVTELLQKPYFKQPRIAVLKMFGSQLKFLGKTNVNIEVLLIIFGFIDVLGKMIKGSLDYMNELPQCLAEDARHVATYTTGVRRNVEGWRHGDESFSIYVDAAIAKLEDDWFPEGTEVPLRVAVTIAEQQRDIGRNDFQVLSGDAVPVSEIFSYYGGKVVFKCGRTTRVTKGEILDGRFYALEWYIPKFAEQEGKILNEGSREIVDLHMPPTPGGIAKSYYIRNDNDGGHSGWRNNMIVAQSADAPGIFADSGDSGEYKQLIILVSDLRLQDFPLMLQGLLFSTKEERLWA